MTYELVDFYLESDQLFCVGDRVFDKFLILHNLIASLDNERLDTIDD